MPFPFPRAAAPPSEPSVVRYRIGVDPVLDEKMSKLGRILGWDHAELFDHAMELYIALKNAQLEELMENNQNPHTPLHLKLEGCNKTTEYIDG